MVLKEFTSKILRGVITLFSFGSLVLLGFGGILSTETVEASTNTSIDVTMDDELLFSFAPDERLAINTLHAVNNNPTTMDVTVTNIRVDTPYGYYLAPYPVPLEANSKNFSIIMPDKNNHDFAKSNYNTSEPIGNIKYQVQKSIETTNKNIKLCNIVYTLEAKAKNYTVKFNGNDSTSGTMNDATMTFNQASTLPKNSYTRDYYKFDGWSADFLHNRELNNNAIYQSGQDTILGYVKKAKDGTISFEAKNTGTTNVWANFMYPFNEDIQKDKDYYVILNIQEMEYTGDPNIAISSDKGAESYNTAQFSNFVKSMKDLKIGKQIFKVHTLTEPGSMYSLRSFASLEPNESLKMKFKMYLTDNPHVDPTVVYTDGQEVVNLSSEGDLSLNAVWNPNTITLNFHSNGGTRYTKDDKPLETKDILANPVYTVDDVTNSSGIFSFTDNNGTLYMKREGYHYPYVSQEWILNNPNSGIYQSGGGVTYFKDIAIKAGKDEALKKGNVTVDLYANWIPITYTIKLHGNDGGLVEGKSNIIQATYDQGVTIPDGVFKKSIVPLLNYNTISDGSGKTYNIGDSVKNLTNENNGTVYLYAQWDSAIDFNSIYHKGRLGNGYNDGENVKSFYYKITKSDGSVIEKTVTNGDLVYNGIKQGDIVEIQFIDYRFGYQFTNFLIKNSTDSNSIIGNGVTLLSQDETNIKFRVDKTYSDTRSTISLGWYNKEIPYSLSYNLDGGNLANGLTNPTGYNVRSENIILNNPTKSGYTFEGWEEVLRPTQWHKGDLKNVQGDPFGGAPMESTRGAYYSDFVSVKAGNKYKSDGTAVGARYYDKNFNYIAYVTDALNGGYTVPQDGYIRFVMPGYEKYKDTILPHVKLTNMTLQKNITVEKGSVGNREYTAKWTPIQWTVKYDANGGTGSMTDSTHIFYGYKKLNKNTFSREGYNFSGWHLSRVNNGKTEWLYANKDGVYINANQWYEIGKQPNGYILYKMHDQQILQEANQINDAVIIAHAQWTLQKYKINYNLDGGVLPSNAPTTYTIEDKVILPTPTKDGHKFNGWKMNIKPESWEDGFISLETGEDGLGSTGAGYTNAKRTGFIKLNKGVTYKLSINDAYGRMRIYDINKKYNMNIGGNENREFILTPTEDIYTRLLVLDSTAVNVEDVYLKIENYTSIPKGTTGDITLNAEWEKLPPVMMSGPDFQTKIAGIKNTITEIEFVSEINATAKNLASGGNVTRAGDRDPVDKVYDFSHNQDRSILGWTMLGETKLYISGDGIIQANEDCSKMFYDLKNTTSISGLQFLNTENTSSMSGMFQNVGANCQKLVIQGLDSWNTSNVTNMSDMFSSAGYDAKTWSIGDLSQWNVGKVIDMSYMFNSAGRYATSWSIGNLSHWDTSNVIDMYNMFNSVGQEATNYIDCGLTIKNPNTTVSNMFKDSFNYFISNSFKVHYIDDATKVKAQEAVNTNNSGKVILGSLVN